MPKVVCPQCSRWILPVGASCLPARELAWQTAPDCSSEPGQATPRPVSVGAGSGSGPPRNTGLGGRPGLLAAPPRSSRSARHRFWGEERVVVRLTLLWTQFLSWDEGPGAPTWPPRPAPRLHGAGCRARLLSPFFFTVLKLLRQSRPPDPARLAVTLGSLPPALLSPSGLGACPAQPRPLAAGRMQVQWKPPPRPRLPGIR